MRITAPVEKMTAMMTNKQYLTDHFDHSVLAECGFLLIPKMADQAFISKWYGQYKNDRFYPLDRHPSRMMLCDEADGRELLEADFLKMLGRELFDGNTGCHFPQIFRKNGEYRDKVFLHNDIMYMTGSAERYSLFIALTDCHPKNGGLILYPGTHKLGLLGDAGELDNKSLPDGFPTVCPSLAPGDILLMHSAVWHESEPNLEGSERLYIEIKLNHIDDPTNQLEICGTRNAEWALPEKVDEIFVNSRIQRILRMGKQGATPD